METPPVIRARRRWGAGGFVLGLVVGLPGGALAYSELFEDENYEMCRSPAAESQVYPGDATMTGDRNWRYGVVATIVNVPEDATVVVGFRNAQPGSAWRDSEPLPPEESRIRLYIGPDSVKFRTQYEAPRGSEACLRGPKTAFSHAPLPVAELPHGTEPRWQ